MLIYGFSLIREGSLDFVFCICVSSFLCFVCSDYYHTILFGAAAARKELHKTWTDSI